MRLAGDPEEWIGERVVVIGTSTGATLALSLVERPEMAAVNALVLISPNFLTDGLVRRIADLAG